MSSELLQLSALAAAIGACMGSFISLISWRLPRDEPVVATRSRCPSCLHVLGVRDLFPIVSWLLSKGRCRYCRARVSARYPLTELACAVGAVALLAWFGPSWLTLIYMFLWWGAVAMIVTDLEHYIILDELQIFLALLGAAYVGVMGIDPIAAIMAALAGVIGGLALKYGFLFVVQKDGLGLGDVKFFGVAGIWLADSAAFVPFLFLSGLLGILSAILWRILKRGEVFPFGPALMMSLLVCVYYPTAASGFWRLYGFLQH